MFRICNQVSTLTALDLVLIVDPCKKCRPLLFSVDQTPRNKLPSCGMSVTTLQQAKGN